MKTILGKTVNIYLCLKYIFNRIKKNILKCPIAMLYSFENWCLKPGRYSCLPQRNPCSPPRCEDDLLLPGRTSNEYVECGLVGTCAERNCTRRFMFIASEQRCVPRPSSNPPAV